MRNYYSLSEEEYIENALYCFDVDLEFAKDDEERDRLRQLKNDQIQRYIEEKRIFDSLPKEEQQNAIIKKFLENLKLETEENSNMQFVREMYDSNGPRTNLEHGRLLWIKEDLKNRKAYYNSPSNVRQLIHNEDRRLDTNLSNYNFFAYCLSKYKNMEFDIELDEQIIKTSILMFLLDADFDNNSSYSSCTINYVSDNQSIREVPKMIRNAASHGEFYPEIEKNAFCLDQNSNLVRIENNSLHSITVEYSELRCFVIDNLSIEIKSKYPFLIKLIDLESLKLEDISQQEMEEVLSFTLNNIIQYNTEHHFKDEDMADDFDLSLFTFIDINGDGQAIPSLSNYEKLKIIKNALGHGHVEWNNGCVLLDNIYPSQNIHQRALCNIDDLIMSLIQYDMYDNSLTSQTHYSMKK